VYTPRHILPLALALFAAGCSVMYADQADKKQCKADDDCAGRAADSELVCNVKLGVCESPDATARTCDEDGDCPASMLCGFDGYCYEKWGCLEDGLDWPDAQQSFTYSAPIVSLQNPSDPDLLGDSIEVMACSGGDPDCRSPLAVGELDDDKYLTLRFDDFKEPLFSGFIRIRDTGGDDGLEFMPVYVHYGVKTRLVSDLPVQSRIFMVDPLTYQGLATIADADADPKAGTVIFIVQDCGGRTAAKVAMKPVGMSDYKFIAVQGGNQPVQGATSTTEDGAGLFVNMPPDAARTFVLSDEDSGRVIDEISLNVRGAATNYVFYYPRYSALQRWVTEYEERADP
jgi:hypothetical protein